MATVHCLVTCRDASLIPECTLAFRTFKVGFPTSRLRVYINGPKHRSEIVSALPEGTEFEDIDTIHHKFIEFLVATEQEAFWLMDADVSFWSKVEDWKFEKSIAGRRIPEFKDEFSNCITRSRLHPSLMWIDPVKVRDQIKEYHDSVFNSVFTPHCNLFYPSIDPLRHESYFSDTLSKLYHAIGGQSFTDRQLDSYSHMFFGSISDIVLPELANGAAMKSSRDECLTNPDAFRGVWRKQQEYFESRQPFVTGRPEYRAPDPATAAESQKWNLEMCCGNRDAMEFSNLWFQYCHLIDDLEDSMEDGRPVMSKDEITGIFFKAALLYNTRFWRTYSEMLFPLVLSITDDYATSVAWERSSKPHLRQLANTMRQCGNKMYSMIALICGGEEHMRSFGRKIQERDYLLQNDPDLKPL